MMYRVGSVFSFFFFFQAEDGIRDYKVTGVQTCALPIWLLSSIARLRFTGRSLYSCRERYLSISPHAARKFFAGLERRVTANYQHPGWARLDDRSGPCRTIKLSSFTMRSPLRRRKPCPPPPAK